MEQQTRTWSASLPQKDRKHIIIIVITSYYLRCRSKGLPRRIPVMNLDVFCYLWTPDSGCKWPKHVANIKS
jgi:hypothetical protein